MKTIDYLRPGVISRYTDTSGIKLAVCVGFGRDSRRRPRVRLYRAASEKWTTPQLVEWTHLAAIDRIEIDRLMTRLLAKATEALRATPDLGFRTDDVALLVEVRRALGRLDAELAALFVGANPAELATQLDRAGLRSGISGLLMPERAQHPRSDHDGDGPCAACAVTTDQRQEGKP